MLIHRQKSLGSEHISFSQAKVPGKGSAWAGLSHVPQVGRLDEDAAGAKPLVEPCSYPSDLPCAVSIGP